MGAALLQALRRHAQGSGMEDLIVWPSEGSVSLYRRSGSSLRPICWRHGEPTTRRCGR
ncbi:hypothetical protein ACF07V_34520 [Streptomyces sp. NPDC015661]|uniref:hypothetical protein n=1 Tax=Streptomyces sp. NPDC015661 TaxID=3364961 RepID=UPI0036FACA5F